MSKIKTPQEKKRLAYEDHVTPAEYPHGFRKSYPKKKAKAERAARQRVRQVLKSEGDGDAIKGIERKTVRKWGSVTVRESLEKKRAKRAILAGHKKHRTPPKPAPSELP